VSRLTTYPAGKPYLIATWGRRPLRLVSVKARWVQGCALNAPALAAVNELANAALVIHSTCRECGGSLLVTNPDDTVHPLCTPKPTQAERLAEHWLEAVESGDTALETQLQEQIDKLDRRPPRLHDAALAYAGWGWPVFPLKPRDKRPATRNGFKDATTDIDRINAWWSRHPDSNIGLPTGRAFDVVDIDVPQGPVSLTRLLAQVDPITGRGAIPDCHGQVATASGGLHLYVKPTGEGNTAGIFPGIDHRGRGGYVVAPPSTLGERGRSWSWTFAPSPAIKGVANVNAC
jgi:hypothetical protein